MKVSLPFLSHGIRARRPQRRPRTLSSRCSNVTLCDEDIPEIKSDESDDSRLLSENLKMLFKQSIIESNTLEESSRTDRSTKCAFEREAETYAHGFANVVVCRFPLDLTSTLADFLADAIVSASKRTNFDVVMKKK